MTPDQKRQMEEMRHHADHLILALDSNPLLNPVVRQRSINKVWSAVLAIEEELLSGVTYPAYQCRRDWPAAFMERQR